MPSRERITLTPITYTASPGGGRVRTPGEALTLIAVAVEAPALRLIVEGTIAVEFDTEFQLRRTPMIENVDESWELAARGKKWKIVRRRVFATKGRRSVNMVGFQAKAS